MLLGLVGPEDLPWPANSPAYEAAKNTHLHLRPGQGEVAARRRRVSATCSWTLSSRRRCPSTARSPRSYQSRLGEDWRHVQRAEHGYRGAVRRHPQPEVQRLLHVERLVGGDGAGQHAGRRRQPESEHQQRRVQRRRVHAAWRSAAAEPDAAKRKQIYSQLNDFILDQSFGLPLAPSTSRVSSPVPRARPRLPLSTT